MAGGTLQVSYGGSVFTVSNIGAINGFGAFTQNVSNGGDRNGAIVNNGTITASGGALRLVSGTLAGGTGTVGNADAASVFALDGGTITGTVKGVGTKGLQVTGNGSNLFSNAIINGLTTFPSGGYALANGVSGVLNGTALFTGGNFQIQYGGSAFSIGNGGLVHGYGYLTQNVSNGGDRNGSLVNNGTITADDPTGKPFSLSVNNLVDSGAINAVNGGNLYITGGYLNGNGGTIGNVDVNSFAGLNGGGITGTIIGNGVNGLQVTGSGSNNFSGAALGGLITLPAGGYVLAANTNTLDGTALFAGGTMQAQYGGSVFTVANTGLLHGFGSLTQNVSNGGDRNGSLVNNGIINADAHNAAIASSINTLINNSAITASNGGSFLLNGGYLVGGTIGNADAGSFAGLNGGGATGTITGNGINGLQVTGSGGNNFNGAVLNGLVTIPANGYVLTVSANTLNGTALFAGGTMQAQYGGSVFTVANTGLLHGFGSLTQNVSNGGDRNGSLVNNGTIAADVAGQALNINFNSFTSHGTLIAYPNCTLTLGGNISPVTGIVTANGTISSSLTFNTGSNIPGEAGMLNGAGTINGNVTNINGVVIPGYNLGALTVTGTYTQGKYGQLKIALGGVTAGTQYTQLNVGTAALDGTLVIQLINGYQPHLGDTFKIITHNARAGSFASIMNVSPYGFEVVYNAKDVSLKVISGPETVGPLAWADNAFGEVGDGTTTQRNTPVAVSGLSGAVAAAGGGYHSLAIKADATVVAWGRNDSGQVGDGTTTTRTAPVPVSGLSGILVVAGGGYHSLALKNDGTVYAWGSNQFGQLGLGSSDANPHTAPVQVLGLTGIIAIGAGLNHSLALKSDGTVYAWGLNGNGQLGDTTTTQRNSPVLVSGLSGAFAISCGAYHSLAIKVDGTVTAWGRNDSGQLGDGTTTQRNSPVGVIGVSGASAIAGGGFHSLALTGNGNLYVWGRNDSGQLGDLSYTNQSTPEALPNLPGVLAISAGFSHSIAVKMDGTVYAWGGNQFGQLGDGTAVYNRNYPAPSVNIASAFTVAGGGNHSLALSVQTATISGKVTLEGCVNPVQNITFAFRFPDNRTYFTRTMPLNADGSFSLPNVPRNNYTLWIKGEKWLAVTAPADTTSGNVTNIHVTLPAGDANNDNSVDSSDFGLLIGSFNTAATDPDFDTRADLNCDGSVDSSDFGLLIGNFNQIGAP